MRRELVTTCEQWNAFISRWWASDDFLLTVHLEEPLLGSGVGDPDPPDDDGRIDVESDVPMHEQLDHVLDDGLAELQAAQLADTRKPSGIT